MDEQHYKSDKQPCFSDKRGDLTAEKVFYNLENNDDWVVQFVAFHDA